MYVAITTWLCGSVTTYSSWNTGRPLPPSLFPSPSHILPSCPPFSPSSFPSSPSFLSLRAAVVATRVVQDSFCYGLFTAMTGAATSYLALLMGKLPPPSLPPSLPPSFQ